MPERPGLGSLRNGALVHVRVPVARCRQCGRLVFNFEADCRATERCTRTDDGKQRRAFAYLPGQELCGCAPEIWLAVADPEDS
jgi:hypothetical protein